MTRNFQPLDGDNLFGSEFLRVLFDPGDFNRPFCTGRLLIHFAGTYYTSSPATTQPVISVLEDNRSGIRRKLVPSPGGISQTGSGILGRGFKKWLGTGEVPLQTGSGRRKDGNVSDVV